MRLICKLFGHAWPEKNWHKIDVKRFTEDGVLRQHGEIHMDCRRCREKNIRVAECFLPARKSELRLEKMVYSFLYPDHPPSIPKDTWDKIHEAAMKRMQERAFSSFPDFHEVVNLSKAPKPAVSRYMRSLRKKLEQVGYRVT